MYELHLEVGTLMGPLKLNKVTDVSSSYKLVSPKKEETKEANVKQSQPEPA